MSATLVLDNGASKVKAGFAGFRDPQLIVPNATARSKASVHALVADEIETTLRDSSQLTISRPFDRGYLVNWEPEFEVRRIGAFCKLGRKG